MELTQLLLGMIGGTGLTTLGNFFVSLRKSKLENRLSDAQLKQISQQARKEMYDDWQEDRKFLTDNFMVMSQQLFLLSNRVVKLESTLIKNNIPLPD